MAAFDGDDLVAGVGAEGVAIEPPSGTSVAIRPDADSAIGRRPCRATVGLSGRPGTDADSAIWRRRCARASACRASTDSSRCDFQLGTTGPADVGDLTPVVGLGGARVAGRRGRHGAKSLRTVVIRHSTGRSGALHAQPPPERRVECAVLTVARGTRTDGARIGWALRTSGNCRQLLYRLSTQGVVRKLRSE